MGTQTSLERPTQAEAIIIPQFKRIPPLEPPVSPKRVIVIAGPTGVGKTALSLKLATTLGGEIISADSVQIYRGMDIGTAKVSKEEQSKIPHHCIDIADVTQPFNVVDFFYEATRAIDSILARSRVPIVVGGSGFWVHALLYGPPSGPAPDPETRRQLSEMMDKIGVDACYERLRTQDPDYASTVSPHDRAKILRGLEIITLTGRKVSDFAWKERDVCRQYQFFPWFLDCDRPTLYRRLDNRCLQMISSGLVDEVRYLDGAGLRSNPSAARAIGYRQTLDYLSTPQQEADHAAYIAHFQSAVRHYAKRQYTWFRREPLFDTLDATSGEWDGLITTIADDYQNRI
jgi:tRNA dimethylallyltransferase